MTDRNQLIDAFLASSEWASAQRSPLAGDASNRRYERLSFADGRQLVLMDAPPEKGEDVRPFVFIAEHLCRLGLSAPKILAQDAEHGLLVLEDLGDDLFARVVERERELEDTLYSAAIDVLVKLHQHTPPPNLATYSPTIMSKMAALAWRWYLRGAGTESAYEAKAHAFETALTPLLTQYAPEADVLIQRDYHAENLLWLPERQGSARVGLLDFQDAMAGHRAYDLVSLLQDARRDVPIETEQAMIQCYISETGVDAAQFEAAYHVLGAQRNLRIIGVFARLSMHFGKPHYVDFIPRVWALLERDLSHPALQPVADIIRTELPHPSSDILTKLRDKCATIPTL